MTKQKYNKTETSIIKSLKEAVVWAKDEKTVRTRTHQVRVPKDMDVRAIRMKLGLSQNQFAERFGFSASTLRNWEQGTRKPPLSTRAFLLVIEHAPDVVQSVLMAA